MLDSVKDSVSNLGKTVACQSAALARRVGPKRGIIALGVIATAIGASFVVRYLRQRGEDTTTAEKPSGGARTKKQRRKARRHEHAAHPA